MPATLRDVAALAGVSLATASLALNGKQVNSRTRERVEEAARKLKYHTSAIGRNLIKNSSNTIGMFILNSKKSRDMTEEISYYYGMLKGALECIRRHEYVFSFEAVYWEDIEDGDFIAKKVFSRTIDGMILVPQFMYHYSFLSLLEEEGFPYVVINPNIGIRPKNSVEINNHRGGYLAADHLLKLGFRNIAIINGPKEHRDSFSREKGFLDRLLESGIKYNINNIIYSDFTHEGGCNAMKSLLEKKRGLPEAVFCSNDYMASGAMTAAFEAGLRVPEDISLVGFDDSDIARCVYPKLTTLRSPVRELGYLAAERVLEQVEGKKDEAGFGAVALEPELIIRGSTRRLRF